MAPTQHSPASLECLAEELLALSKTSQPPQDAGLVSKSPLVRKAEQLIRASQTPLEHALDLVTGMVEASALRCLVSFNAFDALPAEGGTTVQEIEKATGAQAVLLDRLLRILAGSSFVAYDAEYRTYGLTALSAGYTTTAMAGSLFPVIFDEIALMTRLPAYLRARGAREPDGEAAQTHNPTTWSAGQEGKTAFEILEQDEEKLQGFVRLMAAAEKFRPWTGFYDYGRLALGKGEEEEGRVALVDVGGVDGTCIAKILAAHPEVKAAQCVVQDRPKVLAAAEANAALPAGVQFSAHDFFTPQPIAGAKAYQLRAVCHDWSDAMVVEILRQIVPAMAPDSKVLIAENVLPESGVSGMAAFMDLAMLCIGGKERTRGDFERVCGEAGLRVEGVYAAEGEAGFAIVEAVLV